MRFLFKTAVLAAMALLAAATAGAPAAVLAQTTVPFTLCGGSGDHLAIANVTANSWPPQAGANLALTVNGKVDESVTGGSYDAEVYFDGIDLYSEKGDLSSLTTLPTGPGVVTLTYSEDIPSIAPSGSYVVDVTANDQNGAELTCFKVSFSL